MGAGPSLDHPPPLGYRFPAMTTAELKQIVASLALSQKETDRQLKDTDRRIQETDRHVKETDRQLKETSLRIQETDRQLKEGERQLQKEIRELGRQIGGLGNKFGSFTEGLAFGSISRILRAQFHMETITPSVSIRRREDSQEFDILAYSNGKRNQGVVVEVKSQLEMRAVNQLRKKMDRLFEWLPEHANKEFVVLVAFVQASAEARQVVLDEGWYLAEVGEDLFRMVTPKKFKPRKYRVKD